MRLSCGYETRKARVEMLPLIDVVFLLLVFFIYAMLSMVVHHGIAVDLASAGTAAANPNDYIAISIDAGNRLYLNGQNVALEELPARVAALHAADAKPVYIDGDQSADLGRAIILLDELKGAGIEEVSFSCKVPMP